MSKHIRNRDRTGRILEVIGDLHKDDNGNVSLTTHGFNSVIDEIGEDWFQSGEQSKRIVLRVIEIVDVKEGISDAQRGYLHVLGRTLMRWLNSQGYSFQNAHDALKFIKHDPEIDFMEHVMDEKTGMLIHRPLTLANVEGGPSKKKVDDFITKLMLFLINQGVKFESAADYKKRMRWTRKK